VAAEGIREGGTNTSLATLPIGEGEDKLTKEGLNKG
jgi:hypothetical protein